MTKNEKGGLSVTIGPAGLAGRSSPSADLLARRVRSLAREIARARLERGLAHHFPAGTTSLAPLECSDSTYNLSHDTHYSGMVNGVIGHGPQERDEKRRK